ncbi:MAG: glycine cleavage system protein GcvH [Dehalococcoidia bacterium]|jgi:glycine cleavage system H protein|nr:MAG: glycine cleavage system H protein [Chloroflexota bacterium]|tara:strand:- start:2116 stop:2490 length:375 start_codon:yes stop_codon:yes gene_type:complete
MIIKFTKEHEWIKLIDNIGIVGITSFAQAELGEIVFVELPDIGLRKKNGDEVAVIESVKAASEIYAPAAGEIVEVNESLIDNPQLINDDPINTGWMFKIQLDSVNDLDSLLNENEYEDFIKNDN